VRRARRARFPRKGVAVRRAQKAGLGDAEIAFDDRGPCVSAGRASGRPRTLAPRR
jgi:hypothetical protein